MRQKLKELRFLYRPENHGGRYPVVKMSQTHLDNGATDRERVMLDLRGANSVDVAQCDLQLGIPDQSGR
jgi:hypothetical protein